MNNQFTENEQTIVEESASTVNSTSVENTEKKLTKKLKFPKNKLIIIGGIVIAAVILALVIFVPSKFERVKSECVQIAGMVTGSGDYFMIDTDPDVPIYNAQQSALEAIKYANEELGFNDSVYSQMMNTTALMGRQYAENDKYRVSWTYHPDYGLEVTYEQK